MLATSPAAAQADGPGTYPPCRDAQPAQLSCTDPDEDACTPDKTLEVRCTALQQTLCAGPREFNVTRECVYTTGYSYKKALVLNVFLGFLGADRFYMGYPAIGLVKLFTFGFLYFGNFIDTVLLCTGLLGPADGSDFVVKPGIPRQTRYVPQGPTYLEE